MATRLKSIEYWFPELSGFTDSGITNLEQINIYIPESGVTFKSVVLNVIMQDATINYYNVKARSIALQLGSAGYSIYNNINLLTSSGEQKWLQHTGDYTSYFTSNWAGTSMTCDCQIFCLLTGTTTPTVAEADWRSATAQIDIAYEYNDESDTHIKTVYLPLNAPLIELAITKPTAIDTIPALSTWLPESNKTIRQITIVIQGNEEAATTVADYINLEIDTDGVYSTPIHDRSLATDSWYREVWQPIFDTGTTHSFYIWASATDFDHPQIKMIITYEFNPSGSTTILNSLMMPMEVNSPMGGTGSSDWQRASRYLMIQEPETITLTNSALMVYYDTKAAISGLRFRVGTGTFLSYTSVSNVVAGGCGAMIRCETEIGSLSRGRNLLQFDCYRTDTSDFGFNVSTSWIINYYSGKHPDGVGAHNHSVCYSMFSQNNLVADDRRLISAWSWNIPETYWYINSYGLNYQYLTNSTGTAAGVIVQIERLTTEYNANINPKWEYFYMDISDTDPEVGIRQSWAAARDIFIRWPNDADLNRINFEVARRYYIHHPLSCTCFNNLDLWITYHSIYYTLTGKCYGYLGDGSGIDIYLIKVDDDECKLSGKTTAGGNFSFMWYTDTENMYVKAVQGDRVGISNEDINNLIVKLRSTKTYIT